MALGKQAPGTLWVSRPYHIPPRDQWESPRQQKWGWGWGCRGGDSFLCRVPSESHFHHPQAPASCLALPSG